MKNNNNSEFSIMIVFLSVLGAMILLMVYNFMTGMHNLDIGHNMMNLEEMLNITLYDLTSQFTTMDSTTAYINGMNQITFSFISMAIMNITFLIFIIFLRLS